MSAPRFQPLAERIRPQTLEQFIGQKHLLGPNRVLTKMLDSDKLYSLIFWGPPGVGKTTLARLLAKQSNLNFISLSAVLDGVKEVRQAVASAQLHQEQFQQGTLLFIDEVHRFNKAQQDAFLPFVEDGTVVLIGATTENPSFELNNALLSRAKVLVLQPLSDENLMDMLQQAVAFVQPQMAEQFGCEGLELEKKAAEMLVQSSDSDGRRLLNSFEQVLDFVEIDEVSGKALIGVEQVAAVLGEGVRRFDNKGEAFYDQISALHKSIRGSDPNAALYWLVRMLEGGADPRYLARRLIRMASEEIANADPRALQVAVNAANAYERLGSPEGDLALAQAATYLAVAPKSNAVYVAYKQVLKEIKEIGSMEVPMHLRNAPTKLMDQLGYGDGYRYAHDEPDAFAAGECYFPDEMPERDYYQPVERGLEIKIKDKMQRLQALNANAIHKRRKG